MIADYFLAKQKIVIVDDLYSMAPDRAYHYSKGWNSNAVIALAISAILSIGLNLLGAYGVMFNVGDWGWLIGASVGAVLYQQLSSQRTQPAIQIPGE
jgi:NCS1 family nucleobase:cation symporter-1